MSDSMFGTAGVYEIGDDNFDRTMADVSKFHAKADTPYRVSFVLYPGVEKGDPNFDGKKGDGFPIFIAARSVFIRGVGTVIVPPGQRNEFEDLAGEDSRPYAATIIVSWPLTRKGNLDGEALKEGDVDVLPWRLPIKKYKSLEARNASQSFASCDLTLNCTREQYQDMEFFTPEDKKNLFREMLGRDNSKEIAEKIMSRVQDLLPNLPSVIGSSLTLEQVKRRLAGEGGVPGGSGGSSTNLEAAASSANQVQSALDGIDLGDDED